MHPSTTLLLLLPLLSLTNAQSTPDGAIVPFSTLPTCASKCGPLFDVQGACAPPAQASINDACFCSDTRLTPFLQSNANVQSVCGAASCSSDSDLTAVRNWYTQFCKTNSGNTGGGGATTTAGGSGSTATGSNGAAQTSSSASNGSSSSGGGKPPTWLSTHYKWVIMLIVLFISITSIWIIAFLLRRRYLRKKEREIEMRPPVAIGPHQLQAMTGGYNYGDGVVDAAGRKSGGRGRGGGGNGNGKEREKDVVGAVATPANNKREKTGWLTKVRK